MSVGSNIKKRRYELRMSQQELAYAMGYKTRSTIAKIESGENDVSQSKLIKFAKILDTTVEALIIGHSMTTAIPILTNNYASLISEKDSKTVAVILAGGKSSRNEQNIPNQFVNILGKPVIVYCLEAYEKHPSVDDIYIVCLKGWESIVSDYTKQYHISKLRGILPGASSGILSVKSGLDKLKDHYSDSDVIIFQESTRPMVDGNMISKLLQSCYENDTANICQSMRDYLQFTDDNGLTSPINRSITVEVQSPEAHRFFFIKKIFSTAEKRQHQLDESCCAMLMHNLGFSVKFIDGNVRNLKIIRQEDIEIVESLMKQRL